jgi:nucleotide-binding universal stress UspA family protein
MELLIVWEGAEGDLRETFPTMEAEIRAKAESYFTDYLERARAKVSGVTSVSISVGRGPIAESIIQAVKDKGARALALATHGRSGISRWMYGSTAARLLRESPAPMLVTGPQVLQREGAFSIKRVMIPLDGSELSERALPVARSVAEAAGARLSLVRAMQWAVQAYPYTVPETYVPQIDQELEDGAKAYLRKREESLKDGSDVDAFVVRGAVADALIQFVERERVDLVVMTTHARSGIARAALGSIADRMLHGTAPVLLIPPDAMNGA